MCHPMAAPTNPCREPVPYNSKPEDRDSYKGKQFGIGASKPEPCKPLFEVGAAGSCLHACLCQPPGVRMPPLFSTVSHQSSHFHPLHAGRAVR